MRCDEVKETIIDAVYDERGTLPDNEEVREHLRTCPECRRELEELAQTRKYLQRWVDEPPLRHIPPDGIHTFPHRSPVLKYLRYAAVAAMILLTVLAVTNTRITWSKDGFSFSAHLFPGRSAEHDYYTKDELRGLLKQALDESESRTDEAIYLMMQETLKTVEQDRWMDLSLLRSTSLRNRNN